MASAAPAFLALLAARVVHKNASHRFGGGPKKVGAALPAFLVRAHEAQPCFMDKCGRLEGVTGGFGSHLVAGEPAQLVVDERQQLIRRLCIAFLDSVENARNFAHTETASVTAPGGPLRPLWALGRGE